MDYRLIFDIAQFALTGGIGIYVYLSNRHYVTHQRISNLEAEVDARLDDHVQRLATVEERLKHVPATAEIGEVREMIARVGGDVKAVKAEVQGVRDQLSPMQRVIDSVQQYLLNQGH